MRKPKTMLKLACGAATMAALVTCWVVVCGFGAEQAVQTVPAAPYHSALEVAYSPDGRSLAVSDHTAGTVAIIDPAAAKVARTVPVGNGPAGLVWSADGARFYVALYGAGEVAELDAVGGRVLRRIPCGPYPFGLAIRDKAVVGPTSAPSQSGLLLVANRGTATVTAIELATGAVAARIPVVREPYAIAVDATGSLAVVSNGLPLGDATDPKLTAMVSVLDLAGLRNVADIALPPGSSNARGVAISADGAWAYVAHTVGRVMLPTTQLDRGWVSTNVLSIIDLKNRALYASCLLDRLTEGAADPWGVAVRDNSAWVTLSGVHQLARIDLGGLHQRLAHGAAAPTSRPPPPPTIWDEIRGNGSKRLGLVNDLGALHVAGLLSRTPLDPADFDRPAYANAQSGRPEPQTVNGPRGLAVSPDGKQLAVAAYYGGQVVLVDAASARPTAVIPLGEPRTPDLARRGEMIFHDGTYCFQHWLSCATCHPDGRADGMNWDLLNDGIGNPKNNRSLLLSDRTPPVMWRGVRRDIEMANEAGFKFILFRQPAEEDVQAVHAYVRSMQPLASPHLVDGQLSAKARRGQGIFSGKANCAGCHPPPLYTDMQLHDVGTGSPADQGAKLDTPTLIELWRTAPYLHNGSAPTLREVFTKFNKDGQHGSTAALSEEELDALVEFLLSL